MLHTRSARRLSLEPSTTPASQLPAPRLQVLPYARIFTEMGEALVLMMVDEVKQPQVP